MELELKPGLQYSRACDFDQYALHMLSSYIHFLLKLLCLWVYCFFWIISSLSDLLIHCDRKSNHLSQPEYSFFILFNIFIYSIFWMMIILNPVVKQCILPLLQQCSRHKIGAYHLTYPLFYTWIHNFYPQISLHFKSMNFPVIPWGKWIFIVIILQMREVRHRLIK